MSKIYPLPTFDGTHHISKSGKPAYSARFKEVGKFHEPGLAPVCDKTGWYHITPGGNPAYTQRYLKVWGFYCGRAAALDENGWMHLDTNGNPAYLERYIWVGNFQENLCTVQSCNGFSHINTEGKMAYPEFYAYAGDFRDGSAVTVSLSDRQSYHITPSGKLLHGKSFKALDVFHKGYARAKDEHGWHHIDHNGESCYIERYVSVEPFYNGLSVVEDSNGQRLRINEEGLVVEDLSQEVVNENELFQSLSADIVGYWKSLTISCAVKLGLIEALPGTTEDLAKSIGIKKEMANRLLRATSELRLTICNQHGIWTPTPKGKLLKFSNPISLAFSAIEMSGPLLDKWKNLEGVLRGNVTPNDVFAEAAECAQRYETLHDMMNSYATRDYQNAAQALSLPEKGTVIDVGGGLGALARQLKLIKPKLHIKIFDRVEVCNLAGKRFSDDEVEWIPGDFLEPWPIQADIITMSRVLHDWDDSKCVTILKNAKAALNPGGRIILIETVLSENNYSCGLCDLHLLTVSGGKERNLKEFIKLGSISGLKLCNVSKISTLHEAINFEII